MNHRVIRAIAASLLACSACAVAAQQPAGKIVNDVHSRLNETRVAAIATPHSVAEVQQVVRRAAKDGRAISIAGGRHAMGGQQFGTDTLLIDTRG